MGNLAVEVWADPVYNNIGLEYTGPGGTETLAGLPDSGRAPCGIRMTWAKLWQNESGRPSETGQWNTRTLEKKHSNFGWRMQEYQWV